MTPPDPAQDVIGLYERHADVWAELRRPGLGPEREWFGRFTERLGAGASVLDVGCGHGDPLARALLAEGFDVTGIDGAAALIEQARRKLPQGRWLVGDMRELALGRTFDGLLAWFSLFHLPAEDQPGVIRRLGEHAHPGSVLLMATGPERGEVVGEFAGEPLYHASLAPADYRTALGAAGFEVVAHRVRDPGCGDATVWLARHIGHQ